MYLCMKIETMHIFKKIKIYIYLIIIEVQQFCFPYVIIKFSHSKNNNMKLALSTDVLSKCWHRQQPLNNPYLLTTSLIASRSSVKFPGGEGLSVQSLHVACSPRITVGLPHDQKQVLSIKCANKGLDLVYRRCTAAAHCSS